MEWILPKVEWIPSRSGPLPDATPAPTLALGKLPVVIIGTRFFSCPCFYTQLLPSEPLNRNSMSFGALGIDPTVINNNSLPVLVYS